MSHLEICVFFLLFCLFDCVFVYTSFSSYTTFVSHQGGAGNQGATGSAGEQGQRVRDIC